jgi:hypothetical protein
MSWRESNAAQKPATVVTGAPHGVRLTHHSPNTDDPPMRSSLRDKIIAVCDEKMAKKGSGVGLSFYAFFANKNDDPAALMEAATWWISTHRLDHFEKAAKIKTMILRERSMA